MPQRFYANLLPLHDPLRLAEELAMLDCLTNGRLISGVARGAPREYKIYGVPMSESRGRFEEAFEVMRRAWVEESFSFEGKFYKYQDVSIWPRPVQSPHPPVWVPATGSRETVEWAAAHDLTITPGVFAGPMREDSIRYFSECMARHGRTVTPRHISVMVDCYVADSKARAVEEYGPYLCYLFNTLLPYGQVFQKDASIFNECDAAGAESVLLICNRAHLPQEMFLNQIRRIGTEVLPRLQAHRIKCVPHAMHGAPM